jgi:hypothetical protein
VSKVTAKTVSTAQSRLESATGSLLAQAAAYRGPTVDSGGGNQTSSILSAAREYGRALDRVSRVRVKR